MLGMWVHGNENFDLVFTEKATPTALDIMIKI